MEKELEKLKAENEQLRQNCITHETLKYLLAIERKKARKEFADKVKDLIFSNSGIDESENKSKVEKPPEFFQKQIDKILRKYEVEE